MQRGVAWRDEVYSAVDGAELTVRCYRPVVRARDTPSSWPHVLHVSGGGWAAHDHAEADAQLHKALARRGVTSHCPVVRSLPHRHPAAMLDAERAMRWCASQASTARLDTDRLVIMGSGAGAHAALSAYLRSSSIRRSLRPRAVVAAWPMVDPLTAIRRGAPMPDATGINASAHEYFGDRVRLRRAGIPEMLFDEFVDDLPALIVTRSHLAPGAPPEVSDELAYAWRRGGGAVDVIEVEQSEPDALLSALASMLELPAPSAPAVDRPKERSS